MIRSTLLRLLTEPLTGDVRRQIAKIQGQVLNTRAVRLFLISTQETLGENDGSVHEKSLSTRVAYALPHHRILWEDEVLQQASRHTLNKLGLPLFASLYWVETTGIQLRMPLPLRVREYQAWWETQGPPHYQEADHILLEGDARRASEPHAKRFCERPFGVNLIGHAFNIFGVGEDIRMAAKALEAAGIPFCVIDAPVNNGSPTTDRALERYTLDSKGEGPYAFNLFCMTADFHFNMALTQGLRQQHQRYSLVAWPWEMERWPSRLADVLLLADECWPFSRIIEISLKRIDSSHRNRAREPSAHSVPVVRMPPVVDLGLSSPASMDAREETRREFGLPRDSVLFTFGFDLNSTITRKNPQAVIDCFRKAFSTEASSMPFSVGLVVKTFPPRQSEPLWEELKQLASFDSRIHIIEADLDRHGILALYGCCDIFISLHRSEGLGRGLAEALQLGLDVIATHYGGNTDFCTGPLAHPIDYQLIPVNEGEYPHHEGMVWAEPDLQQAVEVMQEVARKRHHSPAADPVVITEYQSRFSAETVGAHYRKRLEELWDSRLQIQEMIDIHAGFLLDESTSHENPWHQ